MAKHTRKGRSKHGPPFVQLFHYMLDSVEWHQLSMMARAAYIELARCYNGHNNGYIGMSSRRLAAQLPCAVNTAAKALRELEDAGFIEIAEIGRFSRRDRRASEYRLLACTCHRTGAPARLEVTPRQTMQPVARIATVRSQKLRHTRSGENATVATDESVNGSCAGSTDSTGATHIHLSHGQGAVGSAQSPSDEDGHGHVRTDGPSKDGRRVTGGRGLSLVVSNEALGGKEDAQAPPAAPTRTGGS